MDTLRNLSESATASHTSLADLPSAIGEEWLTIDIDPETGRPGAARMASETTSLHAGVLPSAASSLNHDFWASSQSPRDCIHASAQVDTQQRTHALVSLQHLKAALLDYTSGGPQHSARTGEGLVGRAIRDEAHIIKVMQSLSVVEAALSAPERHSIVGHGSSCCTSCNGSEYLHQEDIDDAASDCSTSSAGTPSVVQDYFRLARVAFIAEDRLNEYDLEHESVTGNWELDDPAPGAHALLRRRQTLLNNLIKARRQLEAQKESCLAQGINPEHFRYRRMPYAPSTGAYQEEAMTENMDRVA